MAEFAVPDRSELHVQFAKPLLPAQECQQEHNAGLDTVSRAVEILRDEGLVSTVSRRGTYVSPDTQIVATFLLLWGPLGDHTLFVRPNNPQVATRHLRQAERS